MKRGKKHRGKPKASAKQSTQASQSTSNYKAGMNRRKAVQSIALYSLGGVAILGGAGWFASDFRQKLKEGRLEDIGNGVPTVLQIHDPQCRLCQQLQKETRKALSQFNQNDVQFRVANIRNDEGNAASAKYGVPHVTLVLLNGQGDVSHIVSGVTQSEELIGLFRRHLNLRPVAN